MTAAPPEEGTLICGKYRILRSLGEGGMAQVFEGEHVRLGKAVAIKVLRSELAADAGLVARFEREGRALCKLKSRHVVRVFDVDTLPSGVPFMVMERLEGSDLDAELQRRTQLPIREAVSYLRQACHAIAEAHGLGIVHRDLKPANLFLAVEGDTRIVKVLDFGIVKDEADARLTHTQMTMGTPVYMAPEQFLSTRSVDSRADVWALGATLYELLAGQPPFSGTATSIGVAVVNDPLPSLEPLRPDLPAGLRRVIETALEKDPERRYPTAQELGHALAPWDDEQGTLPMSLGSTVAAPSSGRMAVAPLSAGKLPAVVELESARTVAHVGSPVSVRTQSLSVPSFAESASSATRSPTRPRGVPALVVLAVLGALGIGAAFAIAVIKRPADRGRPSALVPPSTAASVFTLPSASASTLASGSLSLSASGSLSGSGSLSASARASASAPLRPTVTNLSNPSARPIAPRPSAHPTSDTASPLFFPK